MATEPLIKPRGCTCADWPVQIEKVNAPIVLQSARSGFRWQYDGKPFAYCPWCGSAIQDLPEPQPGKQDG